MMGAPGDMPHCSFFLQAVPTSFLDGWRQGPRLWTTVLSDGTWWGDGRATMGQDQPHLVRNLCMVIMVDVVKYRTARHLHLQQKNTDSSSSWVQRMSSCCWPCVKRICLSENASCILTLTYVKLITAVMLSTSCIWPLHTTYAKNYAHTILG